MKKLLLFILPIVVSGNLFSQIESITKRDDRYLRENAVINLMNSFESTLNIVTAGEAYPNELKEHIDRILKGTNNEKIFYDENVRIENDLNPDADLKKTKEDKLIKDYLEDLMSLYKNPESNSIVFDKDYKISNLKRTQFFYYNVIFKCTFKGTNIDGKSYSTVSRIAEIRLVNSDGKWYPFINGIRFYTNGAYDVSADTINVYTDFPPTTGDNESYIDYISKLNAEKAKYFEDRDKDVRMLLEDGKRHQNDGNITKADSLISRAWIINPADKMVLAARNDLNIQKEKMAAEKRDMDARLKRINELKTLAVESFDSYDFLLAKEMIDTLYFNYGEKNDPELEKINSELNTIHASLEPILNAIGVKRYKDALKSCDAIIKKEEKNKITTECYYQKSLTLLKMDSAGNLSKVYENLGTAIDLSQKKHVNAISLRAALKRNQKKFDESLADASLLIAVHSRDPKYYSLRASTYEAVNRKPDALADYSMAVKLDTKDPAVYASKARLEYDKNSYKDAITTINDAITKTGGNADTYYYRALAYEKTGEYLNSGNDFYIAKKLKLDSLKARSFRTVAENYFKAGKNFADKAQNKNAIDEFIKSLSLDTSSSALYWYGKALKNDTLLEKAEENFTILINRYPDYSGALVERGQVRRLRGDMEGAVKDFNAEYERVHTVQPMLEKVKTQIMMGKYDEAAIDGLNAGRKFYNAVAYEYAVEAYYKAGKLDKSIEAFEFADNAKKLTSMAYYYHGRTWYDKTEVKKARSLFEKALEIDKGNLEAAYWLGSILLQNGKCDEALSLFEQALSSAEYGTDAVYSSAMCKINLREGSNFKQASTQLEKTLEVNPVKYKNAETYSWLAYCNLNLGSDINAVNYLKQAKEADSTNVVYNYVSACYFAKTNDYNSALSYLDKALVKGTKLTKSEVEKENYFENFNTQPEIKERYKKLLKTRFN